MLRTDWFFRSAVCAYEFFMNMEVEESDMKNALKGFLRGAILIGVIVAVELLLLKTKHFGACAVLVVVLVALAGISQFIDWCRYADRNHDAQNKGDRND